MTVVLIGAGQVSDPLQHWLKATCRDDLAHNIKFRNGDELRAVCGATMSQGQACTARSGVRLCEACLAGVIERERHLATKHRRK